MLSSEEENHIFWMTWGISKKNFRKGVTYDNIKSHKKAGLHPLTIKNGFSEKSLSNWSPKPL